MIGKNLRKRKKCTCACLGAGLSSEVNHGLLTMEILQKMRADLVRVDLCSGGVGCGALDVGEGSGIKEGRQDGGQMSVGE